MFWGIKISVAICLWVVYAETEVEVDQKRDAVIALGIQLELEVL